MRAHRRRENMLRAAPHRPFRAETDGADVLCCATFLRRLQSERAKEGFLRPPANVTLRSGSNDITLTLKHAKNCTSRFR